MVQIALSMQPHVGEIELDSAALIIIDMQRDFLEPQGFGELLGNDVSKLQRAIDPCQKVLQAARKANLTVLHTREGHRADMLDVHGHKLQRLGCASQVIGTQGPNGQILIRGEMGHDIIPALYPVDGEAVIDKPGKGSFYGTDLEVILAARNIRTLFVCGVTTEVCVHTTVREANDRGIHCVVVSDACASFFDDFHRVALEMVVAQGGIFGSTVESKELVGAFERLTT
jgi:nicotinamidase-related amidase